MKRENDKIWIEEIKAEKRESEREGGGENYKHRQGKKRGWKKKAEINEKV